MASRMSPRSCGGSLMRRETAGERRPRLPSSTDHTRRPLPRMACSGSQHRDSNPSGSPLPRGPGWLTVGCNSEGCVKGEVWVSYDTGSPAGDLEKASRTRNAPGKERDLVFDLFGQGVPPRVKHPCTGIQLSSKRSTVTRMNVKGSRLAARRQEQKSA